jgi:hypothetical protein
MVDAKTAKLLQPGDRVRLAGPRADSAGGYAKVNSTSMSRSTMVRRRKAAPDEQPAVGLIVVYTPVDGPHAGKPTHDIIHPDDEVLT